MRMRFIPMGTQVRENEDGSESRILQGKAIVFNEETLLWDGKYYQEREIISPTCITKEFLDQQDVKLNLLHNRYESLARNNKGEGTLKFELRADGLYWEAEMPKCDIGDRALELVRNKTYTGCSFEFYPKDYTEQVTTLPDGRESRLVIHTAFERLTAVTIAMDPAYESTNVGEREGFERREAEAQQRSAQDKEAERQAEREARDRELEILRLQFEAEDALDRRL